MLVVKAIFGFLRGATLVNDEAENPPKLGANDRNECSDKGRQDPPIPRRQRDSGANDETMRPIYPRSSVY
jgi:hypothetical protein